MFFGTTFLSQNVKSKTLLISLTPEGYRTAIGLARTLPLTSSMRKETDSLGVVEVPADKLWGAQTQRSLEHFSSVSSGRRLER